MKRILATTTAVLALAIATSVAGAQDASQYYVTGSGDSRTVVNTQDNSETPLIRGSAAAAPTECQPGHFYVDEQEMVHACDGTATFSMVTPEGGAMMPNGEPYPQGASLLEDQSEGLDSPAATGSIPDSGAGSGSGTDTGTDSNAN